MILDHEQTVNAEVLEHSNGGLARQMSLVFSVKCVGDDFTLIEPHDKSIGVSAPSGRFHCRIPQYFKLQVDERGMHGVIMGC